ncbi:helix-turn-helix domain-containing protein [Faecalimonas sp.]
MVEDKVFERIEELSKKKHLSLYRLAKNSEMPYSSLNNIMHRRTCPTVATIEKLCKGLNITLPEFFDFQSYPLNDTSLSPEEDELINKYRNLNSRKKELFQAYLDGLIDR